MTVKRYSRLASAEEKRNIKKAYNYVILSVIAIILLIFFGLPLIVKFAGFIGDVAKSDKAVEIQDTTPPAPPQFNEIPENTNSERLEIAGKSEDGATIIINANGVTSEVLANSEGVFNFTFNLDKGENTIEATAKDKSNNGSTKSLEYKIYFDNQDPELEVTTPTDNANFYGSSQRQLSIKGTVDEKVNLTINDKFVSLKDDNSFIFATTLSEGENKFEIKAIDPANNETSTSLTVTFSL
jgi:hypothetical protein